MSMDKLAELLDMVKEEEKKGWVCLYLGFDCVDIHITDASPEDDACLVNQVPYKYDTRVEALEAAIDEAIETLEPVKKPKKDKGEIFTRSDGRKYRCVEILDKDK